MTSKLKNLAHYVYDSIEGYRHAQTRADDPAMSRAFSRRVEEREATLNRINTALAGMGESRVESGSTLGTLHDVWGAVTTSLTSGDKSVTKRIDEGESFLLRQFEEALQDDTLRAEERAAIIAAHGEIARSERFADQLERSTY